MMIRKIINNDDDIYSIQRIIKITMKNIITIKYKPLSLMAW